MNTTAYIIMHLIMIIITLIKNTIALELNYKSTYFNYNNSTLNILFCNSVSTKTLIALICPNVQRAFITTPLYYSTVLLKTMNITKADEMVILTDTKLNSIDSYDNMILISSNSYFYLFKSINQFKKIRFPFDVSHNTIVTQGKLFGNYIVANVKQVFYPYTNYFYILYYNYSYANENEFNYISMDVMYQLPNIFQFQLISYHVNYCYSFLNIPKTNLTACLFISDYNIINKVKGENSYLYIFQITANELINIKLSIIKKVTVPYSCGYKMVFLKESIFFSCPLLQGIAYCNKGNYCNINTIVINSINNTLSTAGYDMTLVYQDNTQQSNLIAIGDCYNGRIYLLDVFQSQFGGLSILNINSIENYNFISYSKELFGFKYYNPFIEVMFIYDYESQLFIWNSNIKSDKYINSYQASGDIDIRVHLKTILTSVYCNSRSYYNSTTDSDNKCNDCPSQEVSNSFTSEQCNQCTANNNFRQGYYCPDYCSSKKFGTDCLSCEEFLKSTLFASNENITNDLTYSNDNTYCEFYCAKGQVAIGKICIEEIEYANNQEILSPSITDNSKDQCASFENCYSCYQKPDCSWCESNYLFI